MQEMTINPHDFARLDAACQELAEKYDQRTFTQIVIDRMFQHPFRPYGSAFWLVGRMSVMYSNGVIK